MHVDDKRHVFIGHEQDLFHSSPQTSFGIRNSHPRGCITKKTIFSEMD